MDENGPVANEKKILKRLLFCYYLPLEKDVVLFFLKLCMHYIFTTLSLLSSLENGRGP